MAATTCTCELPWCITTKARLGSTVFPPLTTPTIHPHAHTVNASLSMKYTPGLHKHGQDNLPMIMHWEEHTNSTRPLPLIDTLSSSLIPSSILKSTAKERVHLQVCYVLTNEREAAADLEDQQLSLPVN